MADAPTSSSFLSNSLNATSVFLALLFGIYSILSYNVSAAALVQARVANQLQLLALCGFVGDSPHPLNLTACVSAISTLEAPYQPEGALSGLNFTQLGRDVVAAEREPDMAVLFFGGLLAGVLVPVQVWLQMRSTRAKTGRGPLVRKE